MSLELGEDDCKEAEADIADQVLDNILKMSGIEGSIQVWVLRAKCKGYIYIFRPKMYSNLMERKLQYTFPTRASQYLTKEVYPAWTSRTGL